jgi:transcription-repair coupling factor (superfamily II helicase)
MNPVELLGQSQAIGELLKRARAERRVLARGSVGSSTSMLTGALAARAGSLVVLIVAHVDDADNAEEEIRAAGVQTLRFPALETLPGETGATVDLLAERLRVVEALVELGRAAQDRPLVLVSPIHALMQGVPSPARLDRAMLTLRVGDSRGIKPVVAWLTSAGYQRTDAVQEPGEFALRGGILDIFPPGDPSATDPGQDAISMGGLPIRLDYFGDTLDRVSEIDPDTMGADRALAGVRLVCASLETVQAGQKDDPSVNVLTLLPRDTLVIVSELMEITEQARGYFERISDARGAFNPPSVLKLLQEKSGALIEVTSLGQYASGERVAPFEVPVGPVPPLDEDAAKAVAELGAMALGRAVDGEAASRPLGVLVCCQNGAEESRLRELVTQFVPDASGAVRSLVFPLASGFIWQGAADGGSVLVLPYGELLHRFTVRRRARGGARLRVGRAMDTFLDLQIGDYVVHNEHGIALFSGLRFMRVKDSQRSLDQQLRDPSVRSRKVSAQAEPELDSSADDVAEFLTLEFDAGAKLHVPCMNADQVQKYIGGFKGKPQLSTLGGQRWQKQKERVKDSVKDLAGALLRVRAGREAMPGIRYPADTKWQAEFEAEFPYDETEDQIAALADIKKDMCSPRPMDRLLCGDVGYGKTELAIRAAFKAVEFGKQVAVLVPTTVLAEQHERTFAARFKDYPFKVASLSRFKTDAEIRQTLELVAQGRVDVVIGTHRLLSKDVKFADLGAVIIDEEQRFGVEHKERLLALRMTVDVLTLSATPIPRTLHMSMLGLRDISSLATAPTDRRAVVTDVCPYSETRLKQIIARELAREGQVFFVHNRVHNIRSVADDVHRLAPDARIVIGHGQMPDGELERVMLQFMRRQADILVCTTIIESGIDIPTANTIIINDADRFGLAELHQLRGRVGRAKNRGYCYLLTPQDRPLKEPAKKRLKAIEEYSMLGAGFKIAMRDLEIRGAGNILGPEQSGHIAVVGYDMFCQLLDKAVKELRNETTAAPSETVVEIGVVGCIPKPYIPADIRRLEAYRRIAMASSPEQLSKVEADLCAAYGEIPPGCQRLLDLADVRIGARDLSIRSITVKEPDVIIRTHDPEVVAAKLQGANGRVSVLPVRTPTETPEVYFRPDNPRTLEPLTLMAVLRKRFATPRVHSPVASAGPEHTSITATIKIPGRAPIESAARALEAPRAPAGGSMASSRVAFGATASEIERGAESSEPPAPLPKATRVPGSKPAGLLETQGNAIRPLAKPSAPAPVSAGTPALPPRPSQPKRPSNAGALKNLQNMMKQFRTGKPPKPKGS